LASNIVLSRNQKILATAGVAMSLLLASLDQTVVGNSMPRIVAELQGLSYYAWVTTAYLLTSTIILPIAGKLGDMFGRKPFMLAGMVGFVASSALCGISQNMAELVIFRGTQGLFGGMLFASVFAVLADIFPPDQRARMQGVFGGVFGLSAVIGPTIGGWLTDGPGWRWVFYVNVPVGVMAVVLVSLALPAVRSRAQIRDIDWVGCVALAAGLVPMLVAFSLTSDHKWTDPEVVGLLAVAAVVLVGFFLWERRVAQPIIPFSLFTNNVFSVSVVIAFFSALGMFGTILFVPLLYQGVLAVSASNSGVLLTPMFIGLIGFSTLAGQLITRVRRYRFIGTAGVAIMIAGILMLAQVGVGTATWQVAAAIVIVGAGLGLTFPLTLVAVQSALPRQFLGEPDPVLAQPGRHDRVGRARLDPGQPPARRHLRPGRGAAPAARVQAARGRRHHQPAAAVRPGQPGPPAGVRAAAGGAAVRPGDPRDPRRPRQHHARALPHRRRDPRGLAGGDAVHARGPDPHGRPRRDGRRGAARVRGDGARDRPRLISLLPPWAPSPTRGREPSSSQAGRAIARKMMKVAMPATVVRPAFRATAFSWLTMCAAHASNRPTGLR